ncbi:hypothetical protein [Nocardia stercoris]|uniref:Uncharacterized protein n=1 Tax=Nocardia stercoris TaxID=2483361 RepID=A0A3M2L8P1_9NOCA|nr:hypothetical protein [Nocardia stercoris]RMI32893.1 hypothetical protein EBN03_13320 [Nocardia stercoris]
MSRDLSAADAVDPPAGNDIAYQIATGVARVARAGAYVTGGTLVAANGAPAVATESHDSRFAGWAVRDPESDAPAPVVTYPDLSANDVRVPPMHTPPHAPDPGSVAAYVPPGPPMDGQFDPVTTELPVVTPHSEYLLPDLADARNSGAEQQVPEHATPIAQPVSPPDSGLGDSLGNDDDRPHRSDPDDGHHNPWSGDGSDQRNSSSGNHDGAPGQAGDNWGPGAGIGRQIGGDSGTVPAGSSEPGAGVALADSPPPPGSDPAVGAHHDRRAHADDARHDGPHHGGAGVYFSSSMSVDAHAGLDGVWVQTATQMNAGAGNVGSELDAYRQSLATPNPATTAGTSGSADPNSVFALMGGKPAVPQVQLPTPPAAPGPVTNTPLQTVVQPEAAAHPIADVLSTHGGGSPLTVVPAAVPALLGLDRPAPPNHGPSHHDSPAPGATVTMPPGALTTPVKPPFPGDLGRLPGLNDPGGAHGPTSVPTPSGVATTVPVPATAVVPTTVPQTATPATPSEVALPSDTATAPTTVPVPSDAQAPTATAAPPITSQPPPTTVPHTVVPTTAVPAKPIADYGTAGDRYHAFADTGQFHSTAWAADSGDWGHAGLAADPGGLLPDASVLPDPEHHFVADLHPAL